MEIGNIKIFGKAMLAPMAGITDRAFREICEEFGSAYSVSEMISTKGLIYGSYKTFELLDHAKESVSNSSIKKPFAVQLFGNNPEDFTKAIKIIEPFSPDIIDINMGCPATKIVKENSGSALMKNPELCYQIVKNAKEASKVPITVKIRAGWSKNTINAPEIAKICEKAGASAITIHGRTKEQGYSGKSDMDVIKAVKESVRIPVIANGDITSAEKARELLEYTNCDMVAIGRGAIGNPWIFKEINCILEEGIPYAPPDMKEKINIIKKHIEKICLYKGEQRGLKEARKHIVGYIKNFPGASEIRQKIFLAKNKQELFKICEID